MFQLLIIACVLFPQYYAKLLPPVSLKVDILSLKQCDSKAYPVKVSDIAVEIDSGKLVLSGTLTTSVELASPVKAIIEAERDELGVWIKLPCVDKMGSCTYVDLCVHGIPANTSCPKNFINNKVPCRCPIPKGTYIMKPSVELPVNLNEVNSVYTGKYWARVALVHKETNLACYEAYFNVKDRVKIEATPDEGTKYSFYYYKNMQPFVQLVR